jgi:hypothetical protein
METATATHDIETSFIATSLLNRRVVGGSDNILMGADGVYFDMSSRVPNAPEGFKVSSVRVVATLITTLEPSVPVHLDEKLTTFVEALLKVLKLSDTTMKTIKETEVHVIDVDGNEILAVRLNDHALFYDVQFYRPGSKKCDSKCSKVTDRFGIERASLGSTNFRIYGGTNAAIVGARLTEDGKIMCSNLRISSFGQFMHESHGWERDEIDLASKMGTLKCLDDRPDSEEKWCLSYFCKEHCHDQSRRPSDVEENGRVAKKARV